MKRTLIDSSSAPYEEPLSVLDARIPAWVAAMVPDYEPEVAAIVRVRTPEGEEWWLFDDAGELLEGLRQEK